MGGADPNDGHRALARIDPALLITQNVDGLHEQAGSRRLVALHGRIAEVVCLDCRDVTPRARLQERLARANPGYAARHAAAPSRPDGDVDLDDTDGFTVPGCEVLRRDPQARRGVLRGERARPRVERCYAAVDALTPDGGALLVAGSSLTVMSGFRFVRRAARHGVPVVIVNRGATRGDDHATYKLEVGCSEFLTALAG